MAITRTFWTSYAALRCPLSENGARENGSSENGSNQNGSSFQNAGDGSGDDSSSGDGLNAEAKAHAKSHVHFGGSGACAPEVCSTLNPEPYTLNPEP